MENLFARATLTHKRETVFVFTAFPLVCFWTLNGYLDLFFILAHSQLLRSLSGGGTYTSGHQNN